MLSWAAWSMAGATGIIAVFGAVLVLVAVVGAQGRRSD